MKALARTEAPLENQAGDGFWSCVEGRLPGPPCSRLLGAKCVGIDLREGTITIGFQPKAEFCNPARGIQGGFLAAMLDDTVSPIVKAMLGPQQFPTTLEFKVSFIRPARLGKPVGRGRVVHRGSSIAFVEGELRTADDELVATSTQTVRIVTIGNVDLDFGDGA